MAMDDDADDNEPSGAPLPPDDRLWRHPSEMNAEGQKQQIVLVSKGGASLGRIMVVALFASLVGAATTVALVAGTDLFVREKPGGTSVQREEVAPTASPAGKDMEIAKNTLSATARVEATKPDGILYGTAVVFRSGGLLITTAALIDNSTAIDVVLSDGAKLPAQLVGRSLEADIAVLQVDRVGLTPAILSKRSVLFGDRTITIDASNLLSGPDVKVATIGNASVQVNPEDRKPVYGLIQALSQATVTPRSPGTVLVDSGGTVIGLVTSLAEPPAQLDSPTTTSPIKAVNSTSQTLAAGTTTDGGLALHFATPADYAWNVATQLTDNHAVVKPDLGVHGIDSKGDQANGGVETQGMKVDIIDQTGALAKTLLKVDDVITAVENDNVRSYNDFVTLLRRQTPGQSVKITYIHNGEYQTVLATVGGKPEQP